MIKIDNYYKFVSSTFFIAYFIGLTVSLIYILLNYNIPSDITFIQQITHTSEVYFRNIFSTNFNISINLLLVPFSYLIKAVNLGYSHISLLTSSFLGQIKLLVHLIPQLFFFISYIIFATLGLKLILFIIKKITNNYIFKKEKLKKIKIDILYKKDILMVLIALITLSIATIIQTHLSKILFIFLINLKAIALILILIIYLTLILFSGFIVYNLIKKYSKGL